MKNPVVRLVWRCGKCRDVVISYSNFKHDMNYCECKESAVDLEDGYQRNLGEHIEEISRKWLVKGEWSLTPTGEVK